jgi:hypothetical protein
MCGFDSVVRRGLGRFVSRRVGACRLAHRVEYANGLGGMAKRGGEWPGSIGQAGNRGEPLEDLILRYAVLRVPVPQLRHHL